MVTTLDRRPTLADVAARAGVSTALASIVMRDVPGASGQNRERVRQAADELGYRPDARARLLRSTHSRLLGIVFAAQHDFHADLLGGLYTAADRRGYELTLSAVTPGRDEHHAIANLLHDRCEALVLLGPELPTARLVELATRLPVVAVARPVRAATVDVVRSDDEQGARQAVDHLVALGHSRIAHIDGGRAAGAAERRRGYRQALITHRLARQQRIFTGGLGQEDGKRAAYQLLADGPLPSAVTVFNDRCAIGVLDALHRSRVSVPDDMSVVGYDDSRLSRLSMIDLTTIAQDAEQLTARAIDRAVDRLTARTVQPRAQIVPPRLVERSTTAAPS